MAYGVGVAFATIERSIEVAQPIVTEEAMCISNMTYITYSHGTWGDVIDYTSSANYVVVGDHEQPANRNAASLAGINVKTDVFHFQEQALYGDTLRVVIDLAGMNPSAIDFEPDDVVHATVECTLINATRSFQGWDRKKDTDIAARYLRLEVQGSAEYARLSRTYSLEDLKKGLPSRGCYGLE